MTCMVDTVCPQVGIRIQEWVPLQEDLVNPSEVWLLRPLNMDTGRSPSNKSSRVATTVGDKVIVSRNREDLCPLLYRYTLLIVPEIVFSFSV